MPDPGTIVCLGHITGCYPPMFFALNYTFSHEANALLWLMYCLIAFPTALLSFSPWLLSLVSFLFVYSIDPSESPISAAPLVIVPPPTLVASGVVLLSLDANLSVPLPLYVVASALGYL